ncbi:unnamed protein product [Durusdinium trenchii]|uniref:isoleucine--tRNA ligase n=2 Tax=Durusdinium trenchii TaxID=1381693 RepID=A0ABP0IBV3_9DINO
MIAGLAKDVPPLHSIGGGVVAVWPKVKRQSTKRCSSWRKRQSTTLPVSALLHSSQNGALLAPACIGLLVGTRKQPAKCRKHRVLCRAQKDQGKSGDDSVYKDTVLLPATDFSQRANAKKREPELQDFWNEKKIYEQLQEMEHPNGSFTLHDGPPYANGSLHMGHALNKILKDIINKFKAATGHEIKFIPGWDCHGLPIELKVLQSLKSKDKKGLTPLKLRQQAAKFAQETVKEQRASFQRYGVWGDFESPYLTLLPKYEAAQLRIFEEMVRGGHIYRGRKPVYWSPSTRTALAEAELEYPEDHVSPSIYAAFKCTQLPDGFSGFENLELAVWTTTPWTIPANRAVAVNPELTYSIVKAVWTESERTPRHLVVASGLVERLQDLLKATLTVEKECAGGELEGIKYEHPITGVETPLVMGGDYITTESGTGLVHTAPGHGADDYLVGQKYGLEVAAPVDNAGNFTEEVGLESLVGANVLKDANSKVTDLLEEKNLLLLRKPYSHKYPYDWRSKKPVITRATPQWFASIDGLRSSVLKAMDEVQFIPESYANRMRPMVEGRSDWCISRQRSWGVPIPAFYRKDTGEPLLNTDVISHVREIIEERGSNAWFELSIAELLPEQYRDSADEYERGTDTMDVWFDSGSSWAYVEGELGSPVDLYLEGQDQHRGWFQSSLITSVAVNGRAPYKSVMTHGFCVDENGRKMSKSIGNVIDPRTIIEGGKNQKLEPARGADVLRFWVASVGFASDVSISLGILKSTEENVRRLRNRARFILGNIHDFDVATEGIPYEDLPVIDQCIIRRAENVFDQMKEAYDAYSFSVATKLLDRFTSVDLSSLYLDLAKDRLYTSGKTSHSRRSCQTVLRWILVNMTKAIAPVLCHLAEDIWQFLPPGEKEESVFLAGWCKPFPKSGEVGARVQDMDNILQLRDPVNQALERARGNKMIGSPLDAQVKIMVKSDSDLYNALEQMAKVEHQSVDGLNWLLSVSQAHYEAVDALPELPNESDESASSEDKDLGVVVIVARAAGTKCERCWVHTTNVGDCKEHPTICLRCADVVQEMGVPSPLETVDSA